MTYFRSHVLMCVDPECLQKGAHAVMDALQDEIVAQGLTDEVEVLETSRIGSCSNGPEMMVYPDGVHYVGITPDDVPYLVQEHFLKGRIATKFIEAEKSSTDEELSAPTAKEVRVVLRNCGKIDPENIEDYLAENGYQALGTVLTQYKPEDVIDIVLRSGLGGRGGAGFPTGKKWQFARATPDFPKFMICNADEGDPGAFMNRSVLEGDPHSVDGRHDHCRLYHRRKLRVTSTAVPNTPSPCSTLNVAIEQARVLWLCLERISSAPNFNFDLEVRKGAGAFVCGEETALISSIEGKRGEPRPQSPLPGGQRLVRQTHQYK